MKLNTKDLLKQLKDIDQQYNENSKMLGKTIGTPDHIKYRKEERRLNRLDLSIRRKLDTKVFDRETRWMSLEELQGIINDFGGEATRNKEWVARKYAGKADYIKGKWAVFTKKRRGDVEDDPERVK